MSTTDSRFIKVDGVFQRPQQPGDRVLQGATSTTPGTDLPTTPPANATTDPLAVKGGSNQANTYTPVDNFNLLLTDMLNGAKGLGTADLLKRKRLLQRSVLDKTTTATPEELRTLSPSQQNAIRSNDLSTLKPEIDENSYELEKAQQNIDNFFKIFDEAKQLGQDFADNMEAPDSVIMSAKTAIERDPSLTSTVLAGFNDKSKKKILQSLDYSKVSAAKNADKNTGGTKEKTYKSGSMELPYSTISAGEQALDSSRGSDGYANSAKYISAYNDWIARGGLLKDFLATYPPKNYINPKDYSLPPALRTAKETAGREL